MAALYCRPKLPNFVFTGPSLSFVGAIIRVGRKHDFKNLLAAVVQHLTYENPTTLEELYEALWTENHGYSTSKYQVTEGSIFEIITLAKENGLFTMLPCAYLRGIRYFSHEQILKGICWNGCSIVFSVEAQHLCILGNEKYWGPNGKTKIFMNIWISVLSVVQTIENARSKRSLFLRLWYVSGLFDSHQKPPLCDACALRHTEIMAQGRKKLWENLSSFFDLPPWAELQHNL
ncbi:hypothetical protein K438DRAFT_1838651 [Mycena galopus ATCC 62051]|nr:hypothetical protein K438DRAFT_1838651 [Mycena galopus ATCC 62051]